MTEDSHNFSSGEEYFIGNTHSRTPNGSTDTFHVNREGKQQMPTNSQQNFRIFPIYHFPKLYIPIPVCYSSIIKSRILIRIDLRT